MITCELAARWALAGRRRRWLSVGEHEEPSPTSSAEKGAAWLLLCRSQLVGHEILSGTDLVVDSWSSLWVAAFEVGVAADASLWEALQSTARVAAERNAGAIATCP